MIYLDNAATSFPKPPEVAEAVRTAVLRYGANPGRSGHDLSMLAGEKVYDCREAAAKLFGVSEPEHIIFTLNCTAALNMVLKGVLRSGDHVLCSCFEHNAVSRPLYSLAQRGRIQYDVVPVYPGDPERTVRAFASRVRQNTRMIVCTMASNVFGVMPPIEALGQLCRRKGLLFAVDAAQAAGLADIDLGRMPIDYLCCAGHKGLCGPTGVGLLAVNCEEIPAPLMEGGTGSLSNRLAQPDFLPDCLESGTVNTVGICGLLAGLRFVTQKTPARLCQRELQLTGYAYDLLVRVRGVRLYTARPAAGQSMPVLSFNIEGMSSEEVTAKLNQDGIAVRGGFHCAPLAHQFMGTEKTGAVRIAPSYFTEPAHIERLADSVRRYAARR